MTQDCSITLSIADENSGVTSCFPKGIRVTEAELSSGSGIENVSSCDSPSMASAPLSEAPWGYVHIHNKQVELFKRQIDAYNAAHPEARHECLSTIHTNTNRKPTARVLSRNSCPLSMVWYSCRAIRLNCSSSSAPIILKLISLRTVAQDILRLSPIA